MGVSPLAPETPPSHAALQHSKPGRGWAVAVGGVVCSAQTVPVRTQYDERRRRDPGRSKTGGEGRRKNNPVSGGRPLRGGKGDRDEEWWRRHTRRWALARSTTSEPPSLARPSFIPPRPPPPQQCQPGSQQNKCLPRLGETDERKKGPTPPDDMAQNQVDEPHLCPLADIRDKLLTSQKCQQKRLDRYLSLHFLLVFRRNNCRESCCGFGDCA